MNSYRNENCCANCIFSNQPIKIKMVNPLLPDEMSEWNHHIKQHEMECERHEALMKQHEQIVEQGRLVAKSHQHTILASWATVAIAILTAASVVSVTLENLDKSVSQQSKTLSPLKEQEYTHETSQNNIEILSPDSPPLINKKDK